MPPHAIERLRTFHERLEKAHSPPAKIPKSSRCIKRRRVDYMAALANDLNTAEARAPIFDLVRVSPTRPSIRANSHQADRDAVREVLAAFDAVFDVIEDRDTEPTRRAVEWAEQEGRLADVAPELLAQQSLSDEAIDALVAERDTGQEAAQLCPRRSDPQRTDGKRHHHRRFERRRTLEAEMTLPRHIRHGGHHAPMEANEAQELKEHAEHGSSESSLRPVAFTMSVLAVLVAVTTVLGHRTHTEAVLDSEQGHRSVESNIRPRRFARMIRS